MTALRAASRRARGADPRKPAQKRGRVFVISSPSGGGKTTVVAHLRRKMPQLVRSISVTTRAPRPSERQGRDYQFVSRTRFQQLRRSGQLLEWAQVHDAYYGTPKRRVLDAIRRGRHVILSIDVQGARQIRQALGTQAVLVFLVPPSLAQLRRRLAARQTETPGAIRRRLEAAKRELACASWYDYTVVNDRLERTIQNVEHIIRAAQWAGANSAPTA